MSRGLELIAVIIIVAASAGSARTDAPVEQRLMYLAAPIPQMRPAPDAHRISFRNACPQPIRAALRHRTPEGAWRVSHWVRLAPDQTISLGWTRAALFYSAARPDWPGARALLRDPALRVVVPGDAAPSGFAPRRIDPASALDVTQVFFCPR